MFKHTRSEVFAVASEQARGSSHLLVANSLPNSGGSILPRASLLRTLPTTQRHRVPADTADTDDFYCGLTPFYYDWYWVLVVTHCTYYVQYL